MKHKQLTENFNSQEFDSPSAPFSGLGMDKVFMVQLQMLRTSMNYPIVINSGFRTLEDNRNVGGVKDSEHLTGNAVDIKCTNSVMRYHIIKHAIVVGFKRIGIGNGFIHVDNSKKKIEGVYWIYK